MRDMIIIPFLPRAAGRTGRRLLSFAGARVSGEIRRGFLEKLLEEGFSSVEGKTGAELKRALTAYPGIGNKVADCISLFAFRETAAFPVDTWIARLYRENFGGAETDREKINRFFVEKFGPNAGIFQQYLFYYKRERGDAAV